MTPRDWATPTKSHPPLLLHPLTTAGARRIEHWFDHPQVQRWLGGRFWIHRELRLIAERPGSTFRGQTVLRSHGWIAHDHTGAPAAFIGGDVYDRWVRYLGEGSSGAVYTDEDPRRAMGLGYVVDPSRWRCGYGRAAITAVVNHHEVADIEVFYCGVDAGNHASRRCAEAAGFRLTEREPDFEGTLYYRHEPPAGRS